MSSSGSTEAAAPDAATVGGGRRLAPRRRPRPVFLLIGVALAVALGIGLFTSLGSHPTSAAPHAGGTVPSFSLPRLGGSGTVGLPADGGAGGHPAVVLFFASWCGPCQAEIPSLAAAYHHQQASHSRLAKVALLGVDGNDPSNKALEFVHQSGVTFPVGADQTFAVTNGKFYFSYLPEAVMVDGNGTIAAIHYGALSSADLVRWQRHLLASS
ncbi:MAG: TlpA family protein disulfide reductase [Acidimicrobiales bacterium]